MKIGSLRTTQNAKMKELWTTLASMMGVWAFFQTLLHTMFPPELRFASVKLLHRLRCYFSSYCYYDITEVDGVNTNELYTAVQLYLSSSASVSATRLSLTRGLNSSSTTFALSNNDRLVDRYRGVAVEWEHVVTQRQGQSFSWRPLPEERRGFTLRLQKKNRHLVLNSYLDYVVGKANEIRRRNQERLLYTNSRNHPWESVPFKHPSTFETLAMDPSKKAEIMADLNDFAGGETFYQRTGRAWKRGYLLYGPPGTGKSSMIAAMANYLGYDIYDLELTEVSTNSELRKLLMKTTSKSIIVIEDIDCSINFTNRKSNACRATSTSTSTMSSLHYDMSSNGGGGGGEDGGGITLSGLLNFTDGLWSCCGSERIFVFTTNHVGKLDPALLRSGRMDMHIHMSYCTFPALKILLRNYLGLEECEVAEGLVAAVRMTPAEISEVLIKNRRDKKKAVAELVEALRASAKTRVIGEEEEQEKRALPLDSPQGKDSADHLHHLHKFDHVNVGD